MLCKNTKINCKLALNLPHHALHPLLGVLEDLREIVLLAAWGWAVHVLPLGIQREGHQDGLIASTRGVQSKLCSPEEEKR